MTFGALSLAGGDLTMGSIAVLPVLIGLAVDYAIQFHARFDEQRTRTADPRAAAAAAAAAGGPTILTAGVATAVGFLVLLLSPIPMVRGFGALLVLGIALALACAICAGFAALVRFGSGEPAPPALPRLRERVAALGAHPRVAGPREWIADRAWGALGVALARARPRARDRARAGRGGARAGHPERGRLGRARARAGRPPGAPGRERAPGGDRRVGRDRRDRARRRHHKRRRRSPG